MDASGFRIWLCDPRVRPLALGPLPAWLWSLDASHVLWANPTGAAIFGAPSAAVLAARRFDPGQPAAAQVAWLASILAPDGTPRSERLRGFGAGLGRALSCTCARVTLADGTPAILIAATERAGLDLPLPERVQRLLAGADAALAVFSADGTFIRATPAAQERLQGATTLAAAGAQALAAQALAASQAIGDTAAGFWSIDRIGTAPEAVLVANFDACRSTEDAPAAAAAEPTTPHRTETDIAALAPPAGETVPVAERSPPAARPAAVDDRPPGEPEAETTAPDAAPEPPVTPPPKPDVTARAMPVERRHPLRFVWQIDADGRFTIDSDEFIELIGPHSAAPLGQPWPDIAATLGLDPDGQVARAIATRDTWSGLTVAWPTDDSGERLTIELSGLPVFDRDRDFRGYRGFGVCRDVPRLGALAQARWSISAAVPEPAEPERAAGELPASSPAAERMPVPAKNVLPFPIPAHVEVKPPSLNTIERRAFRELAERLTERLNDTGGTADTGRGIGAPGADPTLSDLAEAAAAVDDPEGAAAIAADHDPSGPGAIAEAPAAAPATALLDRLPVGVLIYRLEHLLYANPAFLEWSGQPDLAGLVDAGGLNSLLIEPAGGAGADGTTFLVASEGAAKAAVEGRLITLPFEDDEVQALVLFPQAFADRSKTDAAELARARAEIAELKSILDTATDGVLVLDHEGRILDANRSAEALFGFDADALAGRAFSDLLAPESTPVAGAYLDGLRRDGVASVLNGERAVIGRERQGGLIPLFLTLGRLGDAGGKLCAVLRDVTPWQRVEEELSEAKRQAEKAAAAKSDLLAKLSHEVRTPLNAIIGFSEVMIEERFGPLGNERYSAYLKDIRASGAHLVALVNDLFDLSRIEAGKLALDFASIGLNDLVQQSVALVQPQANRDRIIIRTSLPPRLPQVLADARSLRQIVLNLLSNSIRFTGAGGQVIVSTALADTGEVVLRVRDSGVGMSEKEIALALEPFRQLATSGRFGSGGTGLGLPLSKALAEANRGRFHIKSTPNGGTLVEVAFPATRVLAG
jgi:PAS domain S-box-containing protein